MTNKLAELEQDFRDDSATVIAHVRTFLDDHASAIAAEAARVQSSLSAQAVEAAFLPPGADAWLSRFITEFAVWAPKAFPPPVAGGAESDSPVIDDQGGAVVPDALSPSLSGGPVVGGAAF